MHPSTGPSKAERRAAREAVGAYHEAELGGLVEHVREGLARYDAREIDAFELDELIHHYKRATGSARSRTLTPRATCASPRSSPAQARTESVAHKLDELARDRRRVGLG